MRTNEINSIICCGDTVLDHLDGDVRTIDHFHDHGDGSASVFMTDGGVMALSEIKWNDESPSRSVFRSH